MDRKAAAEMIRNDMRLHHDYLSGQYRKALNMAIEALLQPEIVYCKDCEHYTSEVGNEQFALGYCPFLKSHLVMSEGFCAWRKKKEKEDEKSD